VGSKERLDKLVTHRRLIRSRARAQRMIMAGRIRVNGQTVYRPGHMVDIEAAIRSLLLLNPLSAAAVRS